MGEDSVAELYANLDVALSLGIVTSEVARFERLDSALRRGGFMTYMQLMPLPPPAPQQLKVNPALACEAADVLEVVQDEFRFFVKQAGQA